MRHNSLQTLALGITLLTTLALGSARIAFATAIGEPIAAVPPFQLDFDENGNSLLNSSANPNAVVPVAGGGIQFFLPGQVQPGQILINTPIDIDSANPNGDSDLLTFTNGPGLNGVVTGIMLYESLLDPFDPLQLADVQRLNYLAPIQTILEVGPEGANGFSYVVPGATYNGISDGLLVTMTPEPSTLVLGGLAVLGLATVVYRRRATRRVEASR